MSSPWARISLIVPVYRPRPAHLAEMIASVTAQSFLEWQLVLVDDGSDDDAVTAALTAAAAADPRVVVVVMPVNSGISAASAAGLRMATGELVGLLDHDDLLAPVALQRVLEEYDRANETGPQVDVLYTDEDHLHEDGRYAGRFSKPDFSPERLRGHMYLGHLTVYRRSLLDHVGGFRPGFDGSQDYDLALRVTEVASRVLHLPEVLYHWRIHSTSVSQRPDNAPVFAAARQALTEHLRRTGIDGTVEQVHPTGVYRTRRALPDPPLVSVIMPTRGSRGFTRGADRVMVVDAVRSLVEDTTYPHLQIVLVADTATPDQVLADVAALAGDRLVVVPYDGAFSFSAKINLGADHASADLLLLLNDDVTAVTPNWVETMVALAQEPDVGMVGAKLLYEDGSIQHVGHLYEGDEVAHVGAGAPGHWAGPVADLLLEREVSGVTAACALLRRDVFERVGGLSPALPVNFNDVDLSMKITGLGLRILITPFAVLHHYESRSRVRMVSPVETATLRRRWGHRMLVDPYWRHDPAEVAIEMARAHAATPPA